MRRVKPASALVSKLVGERIKFLRDSRGISLYALAYQIGCSPTLVWRWEQGERTPHVQDILILCRLFGKNPNFFLEAVEDVPSIAEALLDMGIITEEDLLRARSYIDRELKQRLDPPPWPDWGTGPDRR